MDAVARLLVDSVVRGDDPERVLEAYIESVLSESFKIDDSDLKRIDSRYSKWDRDLGRNLDILYDYADKDPDDHKKFLALLSRVGAKAISHVKAPHIDEDGLKRYLLGRPTLFDKYMHGESAMWPVPVYVSASSSDKATIGLLVHEGGKLEMFEGNDEASPDTIELVNDLLGLGSKKQVVYGSHNSDVVDKIKQHNELPANLYVSPNKSHAAGYWGEDRVLFSVEIPMSAVSQESHVDWRVIKSTKITKFKYQ